MERLKRKKEDEEEQKRLSAVFEQYHDAFGEEKRISHINKSFIRGEVVNADKNPSTCQLGTSGASKKAIDPEEARRLASEIGRKIMLEAQQKKVASAIQLGGNPLPTVPPPQQQSVPVNRPPKPGSKKDATGKSKMSNLAMFKEELKQMQEMRQERRGLRQQLKEKFGDDSETIDRLAPSLDNPYLMGQSEFADDPNTTNLYLSNLPADIELQDLYETFGTFGPLASAKILYPRGDDDLRKGGALSGFIAFMARTDAERAMAVMSGAELRGLEIRVGWARPVPLPPVPQFVPQSLRELALPDPPSGLPFNARAQPTDLRNFLQKYSALPPVGTPLPINNQELINDYKRMLSRAVVRVVIPTEKPLLILIHRVIEFLVKEGPLFEAVVMERERMNPLFRFLFDNNHPTHVYYRWKLFSILNGDDRVKWRLERFRMFENGSWWQPPPHSLYGNGMPPQLYNSAYLPRKSKQKIPQELADDNEKKRLKRKPEIFGENGDQDRKRGILSRSDREFLQDTLRNLKPEKTAIGDAMVWTVEHADCAKDIIQCILESLDVPDIPLHKKLARFYLISDILANCGIRLKDVFYYRKFFQEYLERIFISMNRTLESIESRIKAEQFRQRVMLCFRMWEDNSIYSRDVLINLQNIFLGLIKPLNNNNDSDYDEDLDGVPLNADDDDEDIDGVPMNLEGASSSSKPSKPPTPIDSAWNQDTLGQFTSKWDMPDVADQTTSRKTESSRSENAKKDQNGDYQHVPSTPFDEERRRLLRDIELKIVKYQDELEAEHATNIDQKLSEHRKKLTEKMEKDMESFDESQLSERLGSIHRSSRRDRHSRSRSRGRDYRRRDRSRSRSYEREFKRRRSRSSSREDRKRYRRDSRDRSPNYYYRDRRR
ncbi:hypothetical protein M3Y96_00254900 [Aphelenchoides besseyi]|nr:hypothetical protein M3Y96_00254900 [Aphelenchoides besseyi]